MVVKISLLLRKFYVVPAKFFKRTLYSMACSDPSSLANIDEWKTKHISINLTVDFEEKQLKGAATLTLNKVGEHNNNVVSWVTLNFR